MSIKNRKRGHDKHREDEDTNKPPPDDCVSALTPHTAGANLCYFFQSFLMLEAHHSSSFLKFQY